MKKEILISVIIPVYNGIYYLNRCIDAVTNSEYSSIEIIVVDDCSTDHSLETIRQKEIKVLSMPQRSGPAAARNFGAEKAKGEILLFIDADVVVKPDTITKVANAFEKNPEISALFGSYDDEPGEKNFLSQYRNLLHHFVHQNSKREAFTFWAGLGAIRVEVFKSVGGFNSEKYPIPSIEDIELGFRLRAAGHQILLDKNIQAKHLKRWEIQSILKTDIFNRALPWSKLILTNQQKIPNDMNLNINARISTVLVILSVAMLPFSYWKPTLIFVFAIFLLIILILNWKIFRFFSKKKGILFAISVYPWQFLYFFYSGIIFLICWIWYNLPFFHNRNKNE